MLYSYHYPGLNRAHFQQIPDFVETNEKAVSVNRQNSLISQDPPFFSFYKGDFDTVAHQIISWYGSFKDFNIITNVPYGKQVLHPKQVKNINKKTDKGLIEGNKYQFAAIQNTFRRFGKLLKEIGPEINDNAYVVCRKMRHSNPMSFEKLSNIGWDHQMDFYNGGLNVNLLKLNSSKVHKNREIIKSYLVEI